MQIVNQESKHWMCVSNINCPTGVVDVYDSMLSFSVGSHDIYRQLAAILKCKGKYIHIRHVNVQRQSGSADCGIFAIAFSLALCMGVDPNTITIDQGSSRAHLLTCFQCRKLKEFPIMKKPRRLSSKRVSVEKKVKLFCVCWMPYSRDEDFKNPMAQCCRCKNWYHQHCAEIPNMIFNHKDMDWICKACCL